MDRHDLTAKQAFSFINSTIFGWIASARDDCVSNPSVIAVFRARRMVCTARSAASRPWFGSLNSSWRICDMIGPLPDRPCMHLDRSYDSRKTRDLLQILGYDDDIAVKGQPAPIQAGKGGRSNAPTRG